MTGIEGHSEWPLGVGACRSPHDFWMTAFSIFC